MQWRNIESCIRLFADDCIIYRKINNNKDIENLQVDLNRLGEWAVENELKINPTKSKAVCFTRVCKVNNKKKQRTSWSEFSIWTELYRDGETPVLHHG
jgi:hypothetical protein